MRPLARARPDLASIGPPWRQRRWRAVHTRSLWLPLSLWGISLVLAIFAAQIEPLIVAWLAFTTVGAVIGWLLPRHPVGWLLLADGLVWLGGGAGRRYVVESTGPGSAEIAAFYDLAGWIVAVGLIPMALLLFPTGRFSNRMWRLVGWLLMVGGTTLAVTGLLTPGPLPSDATFINPFGIDVMGTIGGVVAPVAEAVFFLGVIGGLVSVVHRFRVSADVERQQLRWVAFAAVLMLLGLAIGEVLTALGLPGESWFNTMAMPLVPLAIGLALCRYRLWDLGLLVLGTLTYGAIAVVIAAIFIVIVAGFGALVGRGSGNDLWLAALATAIAATLFQPVRQTAMAGARRLLFGGGAERGEPAAAVRTLGDFRVERRGEPVTNTEWRSRKARQLLKMLVARRGRPTHREQLIDSLWPEQSDANLSNRLAVAVSTIRGVLDSDRVHEADYFVKGETATLGLDLDHLWVDVEEFLLLARQVLAGDNSRFDEAEALYRGEFLEEDIYEDWAQPLREEARAAYLSLLRRRADLADELGIEHGIEARLRILEVDPWDEEAHEGLVRVLETAGRHGEARRARRRYLSRMAEIGVQPDSI